MRVCDVQDCSRPHKGRGLCDMHIQRLRRTGTVASPIRSQEERFWAKVDRRGPRECWLWTGALNEAGYGVLRPAGQRSGPGVKAHRYSAELAGMQIDGKFVLHSCDTPACVNPAHLRPGTAADNCRDMFERRREPRGERRSKNLTDAKVIEIRQRRAAGEMQKDLAAEFGVSRTNIHHIVRGKTWTHLPVTPPAARDLVATVVEALS